MSKYEHRKRWDYKTLERTLPSTDLARTLPPNSTVWDSVEQTRWQANRGAPRSKNPRRKSDWARDPELVATFIDRFGSMLTPREHDVILLTNAGHTQTAIAQKWGVTQPAVSFDLQRVRRIAASQAALDACTEEDWAYAGKLLNASLLRTALESRSQSYAAQAHGVTQGAVAHHAKWARIRLPLGHPVRNAVEHAYWTYTRGQNTHGKIPACACVVRSTTAAA